MTAAHVSTEIVFTRHAVKRYRERIRPGLAIDRVAQELADITKFGTLKPTAPTWLAARQQQAATLYLEIADAVFPLQPTNTDTRWHATTCIGREASAQSRATDATQAEPHDAASDHELHGL